MTILVSGGTRTPFARTLRASLAAGSLVPVRSKGWFV
jgi:hypothetical protein